MNTRCLLLLALLAVPAHAFAADEGNAAGAPSNPAEIRRGVQMGVSREERTRRFYENVIRKVEPSLVGVPERLPQYVELFKREFVEDTRTFAVNITAKPGANGAVETSGWVEFDEHRRALGDFLKHLGFKDVKDGVQTLPDPALGGQAFAVATGDACYVYDKPATPRETLTQAVPGDPLFVLKDVGDGMLLCHSGDGYVGYVNASQVKRVSGDEFDNHLKSRTASSSPDRAERIEKMIAAAQTYLGTKYVWGGRTAAGIDCSGLVHAACRAGGVAMPRDADQQSLVGTLVATRWHRSSLQRGDVLFFLGRRGTISHTGIYLGDGKYIESVSPVVKISTFETEVPPDGAPRRSSFCFAKRVFE